MSQKESKSAEEVDAEASPQNQPTPPVSHVSPDTYRYLVFIILEVAFAGLAWQCYRLPPRLPFVKYGPMLVKSIIITLFTLWHNVALAFAAGIISNSFSREWAAREPKTDVVSTVAVTLSSCVFYFFNKRATWTYRMAFVASLVLLAIGGIGPSVITVSYGVEFQNTIPLTVIPDIKSISLVGDLDDPATDSFVDRIHRASMIVQLEKIDHMHIGYVPQPNWFAPLPFTEQNVSSRITYVTDLVHFNHSCTWKAPDSFNGSAFFVDNRPWGFISPLKYGSSIERNLTSNGSSILHLTTLDAIETSVYLFLGGNSTMPVTNNTIANAAFIDLSDLPSLYDVREFAAPDPRPFSSTQWSLAPLATLLICAPNLKFTSGTVTLEPNTNTSKPDMTLSMPAESPGNIHPDAAKLIFAQSLFSATSSPDDIVEADASLFPVNFNTIASDMFMTPPATGNWGNASATKPLPLERVNQILDDYTLSALKAFTSGLRPISRIVNVKGTYETPVLAKHTGDGFALATNLVYPLLHAMLTAISGVLLLILLVLNIKQRRIPFELRHIKGD